MDSYPTLELTKEYPITTRIECFWLIKIVFWIAFRVRPPLPLLRLIPVRNFLLFVIVWVLYKLYYLEAFLYVLCIGSGYEWAIE